jgi:hypothetical protein
LRSLFLLELILKKSIIYWTFKEIDISSSMELVWEDFLNFLNFTYWFVSLQVIRNLISTLQKNLITWAKTTVHFAEMSCIVSCISWLHVSPHEETLENN